MDDHQGPGYADLHVGCAADCQHSVAAGVAKEVTMSSNCLVLGHANTDCDGNCEKPGGWCMNCGKVGHRYIDCRSERAYLPDSPLMENSPIMPEPLPSDFVTKCCGCGDWLRCPQCSGSGVQSPILACLKCKSIEHPTRLCPGLDPAGGCIECGALGGFHRVACSLWGYPQAAASADSAPAIETVDHPQHYGGDAPHETIKCLTAWGLLANACLFNVVKYISRAGKKPGVDMLRDLRAARWYLDYEIRRVESGGAE